MRYAFNHCTQVDLGDNVRFVGPCVLTGKLHSVVVPKAGIEKYKAGKLIHHAFPGLSADQREFLISGMSPEAWAETFGE